MKKRLRTSSSTKPDHDIQLLAGGEQRLEDRVVGARAAGDRGGQVLQHVAGQGQLGEDHQVGAARTGLLDDGQVLFQVLLDVPQNGIHLRQSNG